ncbi:MAG: VOC family protein [Gemmatimonadota bacterium]
MVGNQCLKHTGARVRANAVPPPAAIEGSIIPAFCMSPNEVGPCADILRARGVEVLGAATDQPWGHRTIFFRDPDGNVLEIYAEIA